MGAVPGPERSSTTGRLAVSEIRGRVAVVDFRFIENRQAGTIFNFRFIENRKRVFSVDPGSRSS